MNKTRNRIHGMWNDKFYHRFYNILSRCNNPNSTGYELYGGRGIRCEWTSFLEFKRDMYASYLEHIAVYGQRNTTLERINNNGNYSNLNCKWTTPHAQSRNKRSNRFYEYKGERLCAQDWERRLGLKRNTIANRLRCGYTFEEAIHM